jgi:hypothetical protein
MRPLTATLIIITVLWGIVIGLTLVAGDHPNPVNYRNVQYQRGYAAGTAIANQSAATKACDAAWEYSSPGPIDGAQWFKGCIYGYNATHRRT